MIGIQISLVGSKETQGCQHLLCVGTSLMGMAGLREEELSEHKNMALQHHLENL